MVIGWWVGRLQILLRVCPWCRRFAPEGWEEQWGALYGCFALQKGRPHRPFPSVQQSHQALPVMGRSVVRPGILALDASYISVKIRLRSVLDPSYTRLTSVLDNLRRGVLDYPRHGVAHHIRWGVLDYVKLGILENLRRSEDGPS